MIDNGHLREKMAHGRAVLRRPEKDTCRQATMPSTVSFRQACVTAGECG